MTGSDCALSVNWLRRRPRASTGHRPGSHSVGHSPRLVPNSAGIDPKVATRRYHSTAAVTYAEEHARSRDGDRLHVLLPWQLGSGFAHGRPWANLGASEKEYPDEGLSRTGLNDVRLSNSLGLALHPTLAGFELLHSR